MSARVSNIATAFVEIRPDLSGFAAETTKGIDKLIPGIAKGITKITVPTTVDPAALKRQAELAVGKTKVSTPISVLTDVSEASLRTQVEAATLAASGKYFVIVGTSVVPGALVDQVVAARAAAQNAVTPITVPLIANTAGFVGAVIAARDAAAFQAAPISVQVIPTQAPPGDQPVGPRDDVVVRVIPDTTGFATEAAAKINEAIPRIEETILPVSVRTDVSEESLVKQVQAAALAAQESTKPIIIPTAAGATAGVAAAGAAAAGAAIEATAEITNISSETQRIQATADITAIEVTADKTVKGLTGEISKLTLKEGIKKPVVSLQGQVTSVTGPAAGVPVTPAAAATKAGAPAAEAVQQAAKPKSTTTADTIKEANADKNLEVQRTALASATEDLAKKEQLLATGSEAVAKAEADAAKVSKDVIGLNRVKSDLNEQNRDSLKSLEKQLNKLTFSEEQFGTAGAKALNERANALRQSTSELIANTKATRDNIDRQIASATKGEQALSTLRASRQSLASADKKTARDEISLQNARVRAFELAEKQADRARLLAVQAGDLELNRVARTASAQARTARIEAAGLAETAKAERERKRAADTAARENEKRERARLAVIQKADREAARIQTASSRRFAQAERGALATTASFFGLRGAVLAASVPFLAATVAVTAFGKAIGGAAGLETQLNVFQATTSATSDAMEKVAARARELGRDQSLPAVTSQDAAEAMTELAKAGLNVEESMAGAEGVLQLATAAMISNSEAVTIAASALNAFGLSGGEASHVADVLTNAANAAQGSIVEMGTALQQSAAVARQVGLGLEDTVALLSLLAKNGLRGSDAGTSLRTALLKVVAPTKKASEAIQALGLQIRDAEGNVRADVFAQFGEATKDLPASVRDATAAMIFGQDAIRAVAIAAREGTDGLKAMQDRMDKQGSAADLAAARTKGLAGAVEGLKSNISTMATTIAGVGVPAITALVQGLNSILVPLGIAAAGFLSFKAAMLGIGLVGSTVTKTLRGIATALIAVELASFTGTAGQAASGITKLRIATRLAGAELLKMVGGPMGAATIAVGALAAGIVYLITRESELEKANKRVADSFREAIDASRAFEEAQKATAAAITNIPELRTAKITAEGDVAGARIALQQSTAPEGSLERLRLINDLGAAQVRLAKATKDLADAQQNLPAIIDAENQAQRSATDATNNRTKAILDALDASIKASRVPISGRAPGQFLNQEAIAAAREQARLEGINKEVEKLRAEAKKLKAEATPEASRAAKQLENVAQLMKNLAATGETPQPFQIKAILNNKDFNASLKEILDPKTMTVNLKLERIENLESELKAVLSQPDLPGAELAGQQIVKELFTLGPEGQAVIKDNAKALIDFFAGDIADNAKKSSAVRDARQALADAITEGNEAVRQSIQSARSNLESLGQTLSSQVSQIIDVGPIQEKIDKLSASLEKLQERTTRRNLAQDLADAERELRQAREAVIPGVPAREEQSDALREFLGPLEEKVKDARAALEEFSLEGKINEAEKVKEATKKAAEEGIARLVDQFQKGQISADKFEAALRSKLLPQLTQIKGKAGKNLGIVFTNEFTRTFDALVKQAGQLVGFLDVAGTEPGPETTDPAEAVKQRAKAIREATANLKKAQQAQIDTSKTSAKSLEVLKEIRDFQRTGKIPKDIKGDGKGGGPPSVRNLGPRDAVRAGTATKVRDT